MEVEVEASAASEAGAGIREVAEATVASGKTFAVSFSQHGQWSPTICEICTKAASARALRAKSVFKVNCD